MVATALNIQTSVDYFESIYAEAEAQGDASRIPWHDGRPQPALLNWLNAIAPSLIRCGARVAVVGCGLGDDARELIRRGYDVTAFDCSATAIAWCRRMDPVNSRNYVQADLFNLPLRWNHRFDLVVEVNTIQSLTPDLHAAAMKSISPLLSAHGHLLVVCRAADEEVALEDGPPWALTQAQLMHAASDAQLEPAGPLTTFMDDEDPPVRRMRALFKRS